MPWIWVASEERTVRGYTLDVERTLGAGRHESEFSFEYIKLEVLKGNAGENVLWPIGIWN